jgi:hypothetical protein
MRKSSVIPNASSRKPIIFRLVIILLLVLCALLLQRFVERVTTWRSLNQAEFIERLRDQEVEVTNMGMAVAPLTIRGERLRLSSGPLTQPAEITLYDTTVPRDMITNLGFGLPRGPHGSAVPPEDRIIPGYVFRRGDLLVQYGGDDQMVLKVLTAILGRPQVDVKADTL